MMQKLLAISVLIGFSCPLYAGVSLDMVVRDASGNETERTHVQAQSGKLRVDGHGRAADVSLVFLGDRFLVLDHKEKSYIVMDEAMLDEVTSQLDAAMKKMEAELANLPPDQRAMVEQMMQGQMQGMMGQQDAAPEPPRVEKIGIGQWHSQPCTKYAVHEGGEKTQEVCATALDNIEGSADMMEAFLHMADFVRKFTESLPGQLASGISQNPGSIIKQIGGFPVHSVQYEFGNVTGETMLESVSEQELDEAIFAAPGDYVLQDPFQGR